eukprot:CAMPEP_0196137540 /NCGR_PEP_ID=MMETSP0910-20130528/5493_1 /TAXON_ID=49265 /ORGANISM="Thalassiosira rotula, Strain GSO102" /LENGTH=303 /DNA_ID=CAMNT_0041398009 /DNA_START=42 /DNA_END=953 /DNA_ORIENTATION=+
MAPAKEYSLVYLTLLYSWFSAALTSPRPCYFAQAFSSSSSLRLWTNNRRLIPSIAGRLLIASSSSNNDNTRTNNDNSPPSTNDVSTSPSGNGVNHQISSGVISHHIAIKTRNIENAIKFYSLLGFQVESKFVAGPARAAWLLHVNCSSNNSNTNINNHPQSRIELLEVPSYMLDEPEGMQKRAIDLTKREELLGLNHFALDITANIPRPDNDGGASSEGTACALYQLQEWLDDLNALSVDKFGRTLRVALSPTKRIIGREVYEMAFLYDADGSLVELLNHSGTLEQEMKMDGWEPWDGKGFVQ